MRTSSLKQWAADNNQLSAIIIAVQLWTLTRNASDRCKRSLGSLEVQSVKFQTKMFCYLLITWYLYKLASMRFQMLLLLYLPIRRYDEMMPIKIHNDVSHILIMFNHYSKNVRLYVAHQIPQLLIVIFHKRATLSSASLQF